MTGSVVVRQARADDMPAFSHIVNHYIKTTTVNFRTVTQSPEEWHRDWQASHDRYPWLLAVDGDEPVGLAYAVPWKARNAYDWCAEATVYVADGHHRRGIGRLLYGRLLDGLDRQGYRSTMGVIALPNEASVTLHEAYGFQHVGTLRSVGYKHGRWCDIGFWQRRVAHADTPPGDLLPISEVWPT
ncbi:GNAT family N-acetyltransferase [Solwaraspora sp. WMMD1047]|uniref:GNAT family N-acetyltransferase n=1 Tax=Solwaraspora sp. WMMD1047 TaxID=3016102 RepID=UPI002416C0F2|nr:GNAT family N-acetyltransferase [Solwaraspora sp. WMMD1047]MDG4834244.1 GNAT family N-acetyltransferase [Solwaraspora sp. WMMD1047]